MHYFPVNLNLHKKPVLVIGGGRVATRKIWSLLEAGGRVTVVSPQISASLKKKVSWKRRPYQTGDLKGAFLAIAATDDPLLHQRIWKEAKKEGVLLNVVDKPKFCHFIFPAQVRRGDFLITVSTGGNSPALAKKIRQELEARYGPEYGRLVSRLGKIRRQKKRLTL